MDTPALADRDRLYAKMLFLGFISMRRAMDGGNEEWLRAEWRLLCLVPSLIGEPDAPRHRSFWNRSRPDYIAWVASHGPAEAKCEGGTWYDRIWAEMAANDQAVGDPPPAGPLSN